MQEELGSQENVRGGVIQVRGDVAMGEHHALGLAGGARGIDEGGQILRLDGKTAQPMLHVNRSCGSVGIFEQ